VACSLFTAFTGASGVTIVALGALFYPALIEDGYGERFSLGLVTAAGSMGLLFAPSLPLILYGVVAQQLDIGRSLTIEDLFIAGILPGLLMVLLISVYGARTPRKAGARKPFTVREALRAVREALWEAPLPVVILGGIYSGFFAVSEAAAVTAVYVIAVEVLILREVPFRELPRIIRQSMTLVGGILIILGVSLASTSYTIEADVPGRLFEFVRSHVTSRFTFLILLNIFLLILGMLLDIFSALVLMVPLILPVAMGYDIHPVHLGIIFLANMQIGYLTPPVGLNLFIASYRFKRPVPEIVRATLPFMLFLFAAVLVVTYWPWLSLGFLE
jgi:C4-dicarboxylate transporter DctM subunit